MAVPRPLQVAPRIRAGLAPAYVRQRYPRRQRHRNRLACIDRAKGVKHSPAGSRSAASHEAARAGLSAHHPRRRPRLRRRRRRRQPWRVLSPRPHGLSSSNVHAAARGAGLAEGAPGPAFTARPLTVCAHAADLPPRYDRSDRPGVPPGLGVDLAALARPRGTPRVPRPGDAASGAGPAVDGVAHRGDRRPQPRLRHDPARPRSRAPAVAQHRAASRDCDRRRAPGGRRAARSSPTPGIGQPAPSREPAIGHTTGWTFRSPPPSPARARRPSSASRLKSASGQR